jgi:hypothetical protein
VSPALFGDLAEQIGGHQQVGMGPLSRSAEVVGR